MKEALQPIVGFTHAPLDCTVPMKLDAAQGETVQAIADRQRFELPFIAFLNGRVLLRREWGRIVGPEDQLLFMLLPAGGGGRKDVFRFVLQLGVTIAAGALLGPGGLGLTGTALRLGVAAATIVGSYAVNLLLPAKTPTLNLGSSGDAASPTYSLQAQGNQARLGGQIPQLFGEHLVNPDLAASPYSEYVGNDLFLYELFAVSSGFVDFHSVRIAKTEAWNDSEGYTEAFSDIEFEFVPPGAPVTLFPANVVTAAEISGQTLLGPNEDGADWIGPFPACGPGDVVGRIAFDFVFRGGAGHLNDDGSIGPRPVTIRQEAREIDDDGNPLGDWFLLAESPFQFATRTAQRISLGYDAAPARYEARAKRLTDASDDTRDWDEVTWEALRGYIPSDNTFPCTVMAAKMKATNQLSSQASRQITIVATRKLPLLVDGVWSEPTATRDIFPAVCEVLRNVDYGAGRPDDRIDLEKLAALQETWTARGDKFDGIFDQGEDCMAVIEQLLLVGRARPIELGDYVTFVRDEKQLIPKMMLTPRQIPNGTFQIDYALFDPTTPDDVIVEYVDARTWDLQATVRATLPGSASRNPVNKRIKGITDRTRAWKWGMYEAAQNKYRREFPSAGTEYDGRILAPLDLITISHPLCEWGRPVEIAEWNAASRTMRLSQRAKLAPAEPNYIRLRKPDGAAWGPVLVTAGVSVYSVVLDADELAEVETAQGTLADFLVTQASALELEEDREPTTAVLGHGTNFERDCKLISITPQGKSTITLELVADDDRVYTADEGEPPAEEDPPLLPPTPAGPEITVLNVIVRGTKFSPELAASIAPAPGAVSYVWELSYDHVSWTLLAADTRTAWEGPVEATTVWLRVTAIGGVRGTPKEWFQDLTATEAPPAELTGIGFDAFSQHAWLKFNVPTEDGVAGIIAKTSTVTGFDPEAAGTVQYDGEVTSRVLLDLGETGEIYARVAAYNVFGKTGLNWSSEIHITSRGIASSELSEAVRTAFENAAVLPDGVVFRVEDGDGIAGFGVIHDGVLNEVTAAFLVDVFTIRTPGGDVPLFEVSGGEVKISSLFVDTLSAETLKAVWAEVDVLRGGRILPPTGSAMEINFPDGFIRIDKEVP